MSTENPVEFIPLNRLVASADNVRRTDRKAGIDELAASIAAHGLLQNLTVQAIDNNRFAVVAGARRHAALKQLAKSGAIAKDFAAPCRIVEQAEAREISLAENVQRLAMNVMDEVEAFADLTEQGLSPDDIARRFGCTMRHVQQRLALASLSAKVKAAYRRGDVSLDASRAFTIEPDHIKQDAVLRALGKPLASPSSVRTHLMQGAMKVSDRPVRFVGLAAYERAGGAVMRDLFDPDAAFIGDPALVTRLADDRLASLRDDLLAQGWGWVEASVTGATSQTLQIARRLYPTRREMTKKERRALAALEEEIATVSAKLDEAEDDNLLEELSRSEAKRRTLLASLDVWQPQLMTLAGVSLVVDYDGALKATHGLVRKADNARLEKLLKAQGEPRCTDGVEENVGDGTPPWEDPPGPRYPKAVVQDLTSERARALRGALRANKRAALALVVHAITRSLRQSGSPSGILISALPGHPFEDDAASNAFTAVADDAQSLDHLLRCDLDALLNRLAEAAATSLDLAQQGDTAADHAKQDIADVLAEALSLDMSAHWRANAAFWTRLPKALLLDVLATSPDLAQLNSSEREKRLSAHAKMKRSDLAAFVERTLAGADWLPPMLRTPDSSARYELTRAGAAALGSS